MPGARLGASGAAKPPPAAAMRGRRLRSPTDAPRLPAPLPPCPAMPLGIAPSVAAQLLFLLFLARQTRDLCATPVRTRAAPRAVRRPRVAGGPGPASPASHRGLRAIRAPSPHETLPSATPARPPCAPRSTSRAFTPEAAPAEPWSA